MNDELNKLMIEIIDQVKNTGNFVVEQMPDVISQLLTYQYYSNIFYFVFGILMLIVSFASFHQIKILAKKYDEKQMGDDIMPLIVICFMSGIICGIIGFCNCAFTIDPLLKLTFAPKIYLIEYASRLIK